jgi:hypothetical protein
MGPGARLTAVASRPEKAITLTLLMLLGLLHGLFAHATLPYTVEVPLVPLPCPASLDSEPIAELVQQVKEAADGTRGKGFAADCATTALSSKGEVIIPDLGLALHDYVAEEQSGDTKLTAKRDWARSTTGASPVFWVDVESVLPFEFVPALRYRQETVIRLAEGACVTSSAIRPKSTLREPMTAGISTVEIVASRSKAFLPALEVVGDRAADKSQSRMSRLLVGPSCEHFIRIEKFFEAGYQNP